LRELVSCSYAKTTQLNHQIRTRGVGYEHFQGYMFFDSWFLDYPDQKSKQKKPGHKNMPWNGYYQGFKAFVNVLFVQQSLKRNECKRKRKGLYDCSMSKPYHTKIHLMYNLFECSDNTLHDTVCACVCVD
jgi:hypothetical protein